MYVLYVYLCILSKLFELRINKNNKFSYGN